jgi:hypothetical protein
VSQTPESYALILLHLGAEDCRDPRTLNALLENPDVLDAAISDGSAAAGGDLPALRRLLRAASSPCPAAG